MPTAKKSRVGGRSMSMPAPLPPGLRGNHGVLTPKELGLAHMLCGCGQEHLFQDWAGAGTDDGKKHAFFEQVATLNDNYPDGIPGYVLNAQRLLKAAGAGENPIAGVSSIEVPVGHKLEYAEGRFAEFEASGMAQAAAECCFVLVAGGLGERLGYGGIKVSLPTDLAARRCYLEQYVASILALQRRCNAARAACSPALPPVELPLAIMLSGDTYDRTAALLAEHGRFGMSEAQLHLMLQQKVCSLTSAAGTISRASTYAIETKPHGHGDVHLLLCQAGLPARWAAEGRKWLIFFQDTNGLLFHTLPAALGVSVELQLDINSLAIPRIAGQEIGAITKLNYEGGGSLTCNTEYNQIGDVLHALTGKGDVGDAAGYSPFPGNINQLLVKLDTYVGVLAATGGVMEEFVNPKYADETRTTFKKPTRLECMMQDYSKALPKDAVVGFTSSPAWINYSPCKNSVEEGKGKVLKGMNPYCAASAGRHVPRAGDHVGHAGLRRAAPAAHGGDHAGHPDRARPDAQHAPLLRRGARGAAAAPAPPRGGEAQRHVLAGHRRGAVGQGPGHGHGHDRGAGAGRHAAHRDRPRRGAHAARRRGGQRGLAARAAGRRRAGDVADPRLLAGQG